MGTRFSGSHELNAHQVHRMDNQSYLWGDMKDSFGLKLKGNMLTATPIEGPFTKNHVSDPFQTERHIDWWQNQISGQRQCSHQLWYVSDSCINMENAFFFYPPSSNRKCQWCGFNKRWPMLVTMSEECKATPRDSTSNSFQLASAKTNLNGPR